MALSPFPPWGARPECPQPRGSLFLLVAPSQALLLGSCSRARPHHTSVCSVPRRDCWRCSCHLQLHLRAAGFVHKAQCPFLHHFPCTSLPASLPVHIPPFIPSCISLNGHPFLHLLPHSSPCSSLPASLPSSLPMHISSCIPSCIPLHAQYSLHSSSYTSLPASLPMHIPSCIPSCTSSLISPPLFFPSSLPTSCQCLCETSSRQRWDLGWQRPVPCRTLRCNESPGESIE